MPERRRLDTLLAERGLFESRSRAAAAVLAGDVRIGTAGDRAQKPGQLVALDVELAVDDVPRYVSRGGIKLANALAACGLDVAGARCLDVGASTGGFTDCLLAAGAAHVVALDVAYGEFSWRLRSDPRVTVIERTNARSASSVSSLRRSGTTGARRGRPGGRSRRARARRSALRCSRSPRAASPARRG